MIRFLRRILVIIILYSILFFIKNIELGKEFELINILAGLGFIILSAFTLGEITHSLGITRILGYLASGIIFGPYLFSHPLFIPVISSKITGKLTLISNIALGLISFSAGFELPKRKLLKLNKPIFYNFGLTGLIFLFFLTPIIFLISIYTLNLSLLHISQIIIASIIISVFLLNSSIEFTHNLVLNTSLTDEQSTFFRYATIFREFSVIILVLLITVISSMFFNLPVKPNILTNIGTSFSFSILFGFFLGFIAIFYLKYIKAEFIIFIFTFIVIGSEACKIFHLNTLIVFLFAGFIVRNQSSHTKGLNVSLQNITSPFIVLFFALFISKFNLWENSNVFIAAFIITLIRIIYIFISFKISTKIIDFPAGINKFGWTSFSSLGSTALIIIFYSTVYLPQFSAFIPLLMSVIFLNALINPLIFKFGLRKIEAINKLAEAVEVKPQSPEFILKLTDAEKKRTKFIEPNINDPKLNKSLYQILFKLNSVFREFEKKFISSRSEESLELIIEITEHYSDEYFKFKKFLLQPKLTPVLVRKELLKSEENITQWYITLSENRKSVEKRILDLEPLIKGIFISLSDLTEGLQDEFLISLTKQNFVINKDDKFRLKLLKLWYNFIYSTAVIFKKDFNFKITLWYKNLVKYYLLGQSSKEILETVNLVGIERLNALRQIRKLFNDYFTNLNKINEQLAEEKDNVAFSTIIFESFEEQHKQFVTEINTIQNEINETSNQISNRLQYALANPYNQLVSTIDNITNLNIQAVHHKFSKIFYESEKAREFSLDTIRYWINYYLGFLGLFQKELVIKKLKVQLNEVVNTSLGEVSDDINTCLRDLNVSVLSKIKLYNTKLSEPDLNLSNFLESLNFDLIKNSLEKNLQNLEYIRKSKRFNLLIEELIKTFSAISKQLPEKLFLLEESDLAIFNRLPKFKELKITNIQIISKELLGYKLPREIGEVNELLINYLNITILEIKNIFSIIEYHIQTAQKEFEKDKKNGSVLAFEIIHSLFDKLKTKFSQLNIDISRLEFNINNKILDKVNIVVKEIDQIITFELSKNESRLTSNQKKVSLKVEIGNILFKIAQKYYSLNKKIYQIYTVYLKNSVEYFLYKIGIIKQVEEEIQSDSIYINEEKLKNLPFIYRKLFDGTPLETSDFFIGRDKFIEKIKISLNNFYENKVSSTIIVGEPGSGKRSLINTIKNVILKDLDILHYQFINAITNPDDLLAVMSELLGYQKVLTLEELILELNDKSNKRIFILENIGKLFLRKINGYEAIKMFAYLISQTQNNTFWICTSGKYPWNFYAHNFNLDEIFTANVFTNTLHQKDIRSIVMSRHNATGFDITFRSNESNKFNTKFIKNKSSESEQKQLADEFFTKLELYSEGNIISAMYYWLQSIDDIIGNRLVIKPPHKISLSIFKDMDNQLLLILSTLFIHGWLMDYEIAEMFNISVNEAKSDLDYLAKLNLIYHDQLELNSNRYFINKFVFKLIETELLKRTMLK